MKRQLFLNKQWFDLGLILVALCKLQELTEMQNMEDPLPVDVSTVEEEVPALDEQMQVCGAAFHYIIVSCRVHN